jgi:hypothetical protein
MRQSAPRDLDNALQCLDRTRTDRAHRRAAEVSGKEFVVHGEQRVICPQHGAREAPAWNWKV